jgi:hypothetical protein
VAGAGVFIFLTPSDIVRLLLGGTGRVNLEVLCKKKTNADELNTSLV